MNSNLNHSDTAPLLSEVPAEELNATAGGLNFSLWDASNGVGVVFTSNGVRYSTGDGYFRGQDGKIIPPEQPL
jgi:hypothetical protein